MSDIQIGWVIAGLLMCAVTSVFALGLALQFRRRLEEVRCEIFTALRESIDDLRDLTRNLGSKLGYAALGKQFVEQPCGEAALLDQVKELRSEIASLRHALRLTNETIKLVQVHGDRSLLLRAKEIEARLDDTASVSVWLKLVNALTDRIHGIEDALNLTWVEIPEQEGYVQTEDPTVSKKQKTKNQ